MDSCLIREPTLTERERGCENGVSDCRPQGDATASLVVLDGKVLCTAHATWQVGALISLLGVSGAIGARKAAKGKTG